MAESYSSSLLGAMDHLWFHQIIFFSEPISLISSNNINNSSSSTTSFNSFPPLEPSSSSDFLEEKERFSDFLEEKERFSDFIEEEKEEEEEEDDDDVVSSYASTTTTTKEDDDDDAKNEDEDQQEKETHDRRMIIKQRLARLNLVASDKTRSKSSSPSCTRRPKSLSNYTHLQNPRILERTASLRGFHDLELEEVQGFIDLGFKFNKDHITPRIVTLVPGLQRLGGDEHPNDEEIDEEVDGDEVRLKKPYLSEAWKIVRPDSPLLRLRMARVSSSSDAMKQHLKLWARTVATHVTHQD